MTATEITTQAVALLERQFGYAYSRDAIAAKAEMGLVEGDVVQQGEERIVYVGGSDVRRERRQGGEWAAHAVMQIPAATMDALLVQVAAEAGRLSTHVG